MLNSTASILMISVITITGCTRPRPVLVETPNVLTRWTCNGKIGESDVSAVKYAECPLNKSLIAEAAVGTFDGNPSNKMYMATVAKKTLYAIDMRFDEFERAVYSGDRSARTVPKLINKILPVIGVVGAASNRVIGATALVTDTYDTLTTELLGASASAILTLMRKDREKTRKAILDKVTGTNNDYTFQELVADLQTYERLGDVLDTLRRLESGEGYEGKDRLKKGKSVNSGA